MLTFRIMDRYAKAAWKGRLNAHYYRFRPELGNVLIDTSAI
jgi:hypothetical protein